MGNRIETSGLAIGYKSRKEAKTVAEGIGATIKGGELTCLIGANGAGKSTLLRTLAGFLPAMGGTIRIGGKGIGDYSPKELARTVSIVLTEKPDVASMTVGEMVCLGRSPYTGFWGNYSGDDRRVAAEAMATVGIRRLEGRKVSTLSDGERQKAMIAKALAQQAPVMLLDEPTAFLDYQSKVETMRLLRRIARQTGKVVFMSTHDLDLALQTADTLWLMGRGGRLAIGSPEDLAIDGRLEAFFAHDGMDFDTATGLFSVSTPAGIAVGVDGPEGLRRSMLCKALRRNGIAPADPGDGVARVEVSDEGFAVTAGGRTAVATTVAGAVSALLDAMSAGDRP